MKSKLMKSFTRYVSILTRLFGDGSKMGLQDLKINDLEDLRYIVSC